MADALDLLNPASSARQDGMSSTAYNTFHSFFIPLMMEISHHALTMGQLPAGWELRLINCIRKSSGLAVVCKLCPTT